VKPKTVVEGPSKEEEQAMNELWDTIRPVFRSALELKSVNGMVFQSAYNAIYAKRAFFQTGGRYKYAPNLFKEKIETEFKAFLSDLAAAQGKLSPQGRVEHFGRSWERWSTSSKLVNGLLMYIAGSVEDFNIRVMMATLWRTHMYSNECKANLVSVVCDIIDDSRHGNPANLDLVRSLVNSLKVMDETEASILEPPKKKSPIGVPAPRKKKTTESTTLIKQLQMDILERTKEYYTKEGARLETMTPCESIKSVNDVCAREKTLLQQYLTTVKVEEIDKVLNETLIVDHLPFFLDGFESIVVSGNVELGKAILNLFNRAKKSNDLVERYRKIVSAQILKTYEQNVEIASKDCRKYVEVTLNVYKQYNGYTEATFEGNVRFSEVCKQAMFHALNDNAVLAKKIPADVANPELSKNLVVAKVFAEYVHLLMVPGKDGKERLGEAEREQAEKDFITLYDFVKSKKDFLDQYRANLARRLLKNETIGTQFEITFLEKLKKTGTEESLSQSTTMLNDIAKREEFASKFVEYAKNQGMAKCPVEPLLCSAAWPISSKARTYKLPDKMDAYAQLFQKFFTATTNSTDKKVVTLLHQYGRGEIAFHTPTKKYELSGTESHLIVLPMIKSSCTTTFQQIMDATSLNMDELRMQLAFLIKYGFILIRNNKALGLPECNKELRSSWVPQTEMKANQKFMHKTKTKITIALTKDAHAEAPPANVSKDEIKEAFDGYVKIAGANIVRIMKTRKDFVVNELFSETVKAVSRWFSVDRRLFSTSLSELIDQEIIAREGNTVRYIA